MIKATHVADGPPLTMQATVNGLPVYLDNHAIIELSRGSADRQDRFIKSLENGADLMFSVTNAVELAGPQGRSTDRIREFLDRVGPRWFPVTIGTESILKREATQQASINDCVSHDLIKAFFEDRTAGVSPGSGRLIVFDDQFFRLSPLLDWLAPHRETLSNDSSALDTVLIEGVAKARKMCQKDPELLGRAFPVVPFDPTRPTTFVQMNLMRILVAEAKAFHLKKGDGCDFFHVVMGVAFSTLVVVDKQWKRRLQSLPTPNQVARVYSGAELDQFVTDLEQAVQILARTH